MGETHKRVLIVSHNPLSDVNNNGKTLASFFAGWPREKLAQLFLLAEPPSFAVCGNFYRLTDYDVLREIVGKPSPGIRIGGEAGTPIAAPKRYTGVMRHLRPSVRWMFIHHYPLPELVRDMLWATKRYRTQELIRWLDEFAPEAVFFQGSNYPFAYDIVQWICQRYQCKLLLQLTDDYTYVPHPWLPLSWLFHFRYMKRLRLGIARAERVYAISPAMQTEYAQRFDMRNIGLAANCIDMPTYTQEDGRRAPLRLLYAGGVHIQRWQNLYALGQALKALRQEGLEAELVIYTPQPLPDALRAKLTMEPVMRYGGSLSPTELAQAMADANVLVMVESFAKSARKVTRLSLSTKIPEYMAAGRCMLAYGPQDVSSIRYIRDHDAGVVISATRPEEMLAQMRRLFDPDLRFRMVQNALRTAQENHRRDALQHEIWRQVNA